MKLKVFSGLEKLLIFVAVEDSLRSKDEMSAKNGRMFYALVMGFYEG